MRRANQLKLIGTALIGMAAIATVPVSAQRAVESDYGVASISWQADGTFETGRLTVAGRQGIVAQRPVDPSTPLNFDLTDSTGQYLPDGNYTYELVPRSEDERSRKTGFFAIRGGVLQELDDGLIDRDSQEAAVMRQQWAAANQQGGGDGLQGVSSRVFDDPDNFTVAGKIGIGTETPSALLHLAGSAKLAIVLENTTTGHAYALGHTDVGFGLNYDPASGDAYRVWGIENGAPEDSFYISASGRAGMGTATPAQDIHISGKNSVIRLESTTTNTSWDAGNVSSDYVIALAENNGGPTFSRFLTLENAETASTVRGLGLHTGDPGAYLDINVCNGCTNAPLLRLNGTNQPSGTPVQVQIQSPDTSVGSGSAAMTFQDLAAGKSATFEYRVLGGVPAFALNFVGTGGQDFSINDMGEFRLGRGGDVKFFVDQFGNVSGNSFNVTSARASKENFRTISSAEVLERVAGLDISRWNYKVEGDAVDHIGPIAEEFHAAFGVGASAEQINMVDAAGVSLAAIQGLYERLEEKSDAVESLQAEKAELEDRLARLEALVEKLVD